jgi:hypothetical protein
MGLLNLTESERLEILNLHNNARIIKEQTPSGYNMSNVTQGGAAPAAPAQTVADVIKELQTLLNTKYGTKLTVDGKWGNLTQTAFETAMKSKSAAPVAGTPASGTGTQLPTVTVTGQKAPDPAIAAAPNVPLPSVATPAAPGVSGQPAAAAPTQSAPTQAAPTQAAPTQAAPTQAAPQSNRDQRRERQDLRRGNRRAMQDLRAGQRGQQ